MSLIDNIALVPYSSAKGSAQVLPTSTFSADLITGIVDLCLACNWSLVGVLPATCVISYPFGFTYAPGPGSGAQGCSGNWVVVTTPSQQWRFSSYSPGQTTVPGTCTFFELGSSPLATLISLASAIEAVTPYNAVVAGSGPAYTITLTAKTPGPYRNFDQIAADGRYGITSGISTGGGYTISSNGLSPYTVTLTGNLVGRNIQGVQFDFTIGPSGSLGTVQYTLPTDGTIRYLVAANPCSFVAFDLNGNCLAAFAPAIPTDEGFTAAYCVFVVGAGFTSQLMWQGGILGQPNSVSLDAAPVTFADSRRGPAVLCLRSSPGYQGLSLNGQPLLTAAYAMMSGSYSADPSVVGKLYDCMVRTNPGAVGSTVTIASRTFLCIASDAGTGSNSPSSLWFCIDDNGQPD